MVRLLGCICRSHDGEMRRTETIKLEKGESAKKNLLLKESRNERKFWSNVFTWWGEIGLSRAFRRYYSGHYPGVLSDRRGMGQPLGKG